MVAEALYGPLVAWMRESVTVTRFDAGGEAGAGHPDGIKVDRQGNLWGSGPGGVWILSPEGKRLGTIPVPERVSNLAWGDADGKTLYITASTSIYRVRTIGGGVKP